MQKYCQSRFEMVNNFGLVNQKWRNLAKKLVVGILKTFRLNNNSSYYAQ